MKLIETGLNYKQIKGLFNHKPIKHNTTFERVNSKKAASIKLRSAKNDAGVIIGFTDNSIKILFQQTNGKSVSIIELNDKGEVIDSWFETTLMNGLTIFTNIKSYFVATNAVITQSYYEDNTIDSFAYSVADKVKAVMNKNIEFYRDYGKRKILEAAESDELAKIPEIMGKIYFKGSHYGSKTELIELNYFFDSYNRGLKYNLIESANRLKKNWDDSLTPQMVRSAAVNILKQKKERIKNRMEMED